MQLFNLGVYGGENCYFVFADKASEAKQILKDYFMRVDEVDCGKITVEEMVPVKKGIVGNIDWTEPEPPLFGMDY